MNDSGQTGEARRILLQGREVPYRLRRSQRRTLGITIDQRGLTLSIPLRATLHEAEDILRQRAGWVIDKLDEWAVRERPAPLRVTDGVVFPVLGQPCRLRLMPAGGRPVFTEGFAERELHLPLRGGSDPLPSVQRALQRYALGYFHGRVEEYLYVLRLDAPGLALPALRLTSARTRWGSCSRLSGIRLNWRLIHLPQALIDYVVAHETAHLLEMNHSPRFWAVVRSLYPDYSEARAALRDAHQFMPAWD